MGGLAPSTCSQGLPGAPGAYVHNARNAVACQQMHSRAKHGGDRPHRQASARRTPATCPPPTRPPATIRHPPPTLSLPVCRRMSWRSGFSMLHPEGATAGASAAPLPHRRRQQVRLWAGGAHGLPQRSRTHRVCGAPRRGPWGDLVPRGARRVLGWSTPWAVDVRSAMQPCNFHYHRPFPARDARQPASRIQAMSATITIVAYLMLWQMLWQMAVVADACNSASHVGRR